MTFACSYCDATATSLVPLPKGYLTVCNTHGRNYIGIVPIKVAFPDLAILDLSWYP